jgi:hypothetical protein
MAPAGLAGHPITFRALYGHHDVIEGSDLSGECDESQCVPAGGPN